MASDLTMEINNTRATRALEDTGEVEGQGHRDTALLWSSTLKIPMRIIRKYTLILNTHHYSNRWMEKGIIHALIVFVSERSLRSANAVSVCLSVWHIIL